MHIRFDGQTAIVTGAAHGFGRAIALGFARLGAHVIGCDVIGDELRDTARLADAQHTPVAVRVLDVTDRTAVAAMARETLDAHHRQLHRAGLRAIQPRERAAMAVVW